MLHSVAPREMPARAPVTRATAPSGATSNLTSRHWRRQEMSWREVMDTIARPHFTQTR